MRYLLLLLLLPIIVQEKKPEPKLNYSLPLAIEPGFQGKVILRGVKLDAVTDVKSADEKVAAKLVGKPRKVAVVPMYPPERTGDSEVEVELTIPKGLTANKLTLTVVAPGGSAEYSLLVDTVPRVLEKEPNNGFSESQLVPVPVIVDAKFNNNSDPDVYRIDGKKGTKLKIEVEAARLGAPVDAMLTIYDAGKRILATCDDVNGSPDPMIEFTLPADGIYYIGTIEAHDAGGPGFPYRLLIRPVK